MEKNAERCVEPQRFRNIDSLTLLLLFLRMLVCNFFKRFLVDSHGIQLKTEKKNIQNVLFWKFARTLLGIVSKNLLSACTDDIAISSDTL